MAYPLKDKYISLLTDFGFKRVFGTEPNKGLLIDFLNTLLPPRHHIEDVTFKNTENLGNTPLDRKGIFDIYCQSKTGERFIVEIQKAKQNFFKDRSVYYSTFPIQEQAQKGDWDYQLKAVYTVGVLDFVFDDHKDDKTILHTVELKNQDCQVFYDKLKFIYIELPKFTKSLDQLETHFDKWLFVLKNLSELHNRPQPFQESVFNQLFDVAEIANFSRTEQDNYQNSLKYYRDMNNIVETSRQEGLQEGLKQGREEGAQRERALILRLLSRSLGEIPSELQQQIRQLSLDQLEGLSEACLDFSNLEDLRAWLNETQE
ncbi:Rpn family recombination-promoting nuclease/putative transposase [Moorena sp. SIO3H5]|uniref:Rpn family recombination-promoting nuclease/putative transposase n=1 Tax=Moorena sp. SIO3H5 TaxID=2607834 RepID=UPI0013BC7A9D|nr:Rpn family recombination-promoting nuclease/putative transposase [Moorena sp. SIO3H5]NEO71083.1 Rpn family recombination-promoting nuclease/putative transposase [Moorena sp. SIO3H5]